MRRLILITLIIPTIACFSQAQGTLLQQEVAELKKQVKTLEQSASKEQKRLIEAVALAESKIGEIEVLLKKVDRLAKSDFAKLATDVDAQKKDLAAIKVLMDETNLAELRPQLEEVMAAQKQLTEELSRIAVGLDKPTQPTMPTDPNALFSYAESKFNANEFLEARTAFRAYLKVVDTGTKAENAQFFLGEAYFVEKNHEDATREYSKVLESFPDGARADDALYKLGLSAIELSLCDYAEVYLGEIRSKYKKSPFYRDAYRKLRDVSKMKKAKTCK